MNLNLVDSVYQIFERVKIFTGKEVKLVEKSDLTTLALIKIARKSMPAHFLYYKPEHTGIINHLIVHECGHILRMYGVPEKERLIPYSDDKIKSEALKDIGPEIKTLLKALPLNNLAGLENLWHSGMVRQLTNFPSDIMIEKWLYDEYPELRSHQAQSIKKQYDEAVMSLSYEVEKMTPKKILNASNGMNCVFFHILGMHFNSNYQSNRFDRSSYSKIGEKLISLQKGQEDNYNGDIETVNEWAEELRLSNWFAWKNFEDIPANYLNTF